MERKVDTIIALATARGRGALAVIRVSGEQSHQIVERSICEKRKFSGSKPGMLKRYTMIHESGDELDEVTAVKYQRPRSFSGEDMVELICHGGEEIVREVLGRLVSAGARYAGRGEFTRRAFENGKTDLVRAEAINQIVNARSIEGAGGAVQAYFGGYEDRIARWEDLLVQTIGHIETIIEFGEEEDIEECGATDSAVGGIETVIREAEEEIERRNRLLEAEKGIEIVLVGPPNAGKSTLFNRILGYERVLVHEERGTTRDSVSERIRIGGVNSYIIDTAGVRYADNEVEKMGVERTWDYVRRSGVIVWVTAANEKFIEEELRILNECAHRKNIIGVVNKVDQSEGSKKGEWFRQEGIECLYTSALRKKTTGNLVEAIGKMVAEIAKHRDSNTIIWSERQEEVVLRMIDYLRNGRARFPNQMEIIAQQCREGLGCLEEFRGKRTTDDILDGVFQ
ncbi:MAG: GTP-binding protein, partial [Chitinivibrionales bacterium]|nr:GTP-binding protein [Chitinivibrionales bacterium]